MRYKMRTFLFVLAFTFYSTLSMATVELDVDANGAVDVDKGGTNALTLTDGGVLLGSGTDAITPMAVLADGEMIVGDGTTDPVAESGATLRTSIGLGSAATRDAEDTLTDGANLPDGAAVKAYGDANWAAGSGDLLANGSIPMTAHWPFGAYNLTGGVNTTWSGVGTFGSVDINPSASPGWEFENSTAAADTAFIYANSSGGAYDMILYFGVEDSTGESTHYFEANGVSETVSFFKPIVGRMNYGADITGAVSHDTVEVRNAVYHFTAAATATLDAAADAGYGSVVSYRVRDAAEAAVVDVAVAEKINLDGTALAAGVAITATGAGSFVTLISTTDSDGSGTDGWEVWGNNGFVSE